MNLMTAKGPHGPLIGLLCGVAANGIWGLLPLYFRALAQVPAVELLAHRCVWSALVMAVLVSVFGR
jgi:chloramphenicol-sensitive protein RarD